MHSGATNNSAGTIVRYASLLAILCLSYTAGCHQPIRYIPENVSARADKFGLDPRTLLGPGRPIHVGAERTAVRATLDGVNILYDDDSPPFHDSYYFDFRVLYFHLFDIEDGYLGFDETNRSVMLMIFYDDQKRVTVWFFQ